MGMPSLLLLPVLDALVCQVCLGFLLLWSSLCMDAWRIVSKSRLPRQLDPSIC